MSLPLPLRALGAAVIALLGACGSPPAIRYYTLLAPAAEAASPAPAPAGAPLPFELLPVGIPPQADMQELVVRRGDDALVVLENERWIAPLADELRSALSAELSRRLGAADLHGVAKPAGTEMLRIKVDVRRFESEAGRYALLEAAWSLRAGEGAVRACTSRVREAVQPGVAGIVQGQQRALATLAAQIAQSARGSAACPAS